MDPKDFDALVKQFSVRSPRRSIVKGGAVLALGAVAALVRQGAGDAGHRNPGVGYVKGENCNKDHDCASGRCKGGNCACSRQGDKCRHNKDCCQKNNRCLDKVCGTLPDRPSPILPVLP